MKSICVFCGSSPGVRPDYVASARMLGKALAERRITLVYGGGHVGIMGELANAALDAGCSVIGVIPQSLVSKEVAHMGLTELRIVRSMHKRKAMMADLSEGFMALPGGLGTLEELFEVVTWAQLGIHRKPCALLNSGGYYDGLLAFLDRSVVEGFVKPEHRRLILVGNDHGELLDRMESYISPVTARWMDGEQR